MSTIANNGVSTFTQWLLDSVVLAGAEPVPAGPCTCTHPRSTCGVCRANMDNRKPGSPVCAETAERYGTPAWQAMADEYADERETLACLRQF